MLNFNKKRTLAFALSLVLVGSSVAACAGDGEETTTTTTTTTTAADETDPAGTDTEETDGTEDTTEGTEDSTEGTEDTTEGTEDSTEGTDDTDGTTEEATEEVFAAHDLGGVTIQAMNTNSLHDRNPEVEDLEDYVVEERQEHLDYIQDKYNVEIEFVEGPAVEWDEVGNELVRAYTAGDPYADIMDFSLLYMLTLVNNGALNNNSDWIHDAPIASRYVETGSWQGENYGIGTFVGGEGLLYNRTMIEEAGMEMEPNEMFATGQWTYDDFYNYMEELNANLPEDTFPFFIDPYYWFLFAPAGNGTQLITDDGVNYNDPAVVEALEFLDRMWDAGFVRDANLNEEGNRNYWGTPGETFEQGVEVAVTHRASWQAAYLVDSLDFGFVPYPWGENVTVDNVGEPDAYTTLSDNYAVTAYDAQTKVMINGIADKADPEGVFSMFMELIGHEFVVTDYYAEQDPVDITDQEIDPRWFSTELDAELYEWSLSRERLERYAALSSLFTMAGDYYDVFLEDASIRSVIDAAEGVDQATMVEEGFVE